MRPITFLKGFLASLLVASAIEAGRPKCSASNCASIKRDLISRFQREESPVEGTILHTRAELPKVEENGIEAYVIAAVDKLSAGDKIYDDRSKSQDSTSLWRPFVRGNGNWASSFKTGLKFMTGCTAVVIVGPRGVYAAHFFEDIAMDPSIADKYAANLLDHGSKSFEPIKNHFNDLTGSPAPPAAGQQRDPFPQVFIMNPVGSREAPVESDPKKKLQLILDLLQTLDFALASENMTRRIRISMQKFVHSGPESILSTKFLITHSTKTIRSKIRRLLIYFRTARC
jgi:hypothetical protein